MLAGPAPEEAFQRMSARGVPIALYFKLYLDLQVGEASGALTARTGILDN